jgi:ribosomal protein S27AE
LNKGEKVLKELGVIDFSVIGVTHGSRVGRAYLTNERFVIVSGGTPFATIPLESIVSVEPLEFGVWKLKQYILKLVFPDQTGTLQEMRLFLNKDLMSEFYETLKEARDLRVEALSTSEKRIIIDFTALKELAEKGGIVLTELKCPKCGAPIKLPKEGTETTCEHCGSVIYAQDIFEKIKALIS